MDTREPHDILDLDEIPEKRRKDFLALTDDEAKALISKTPEERGRWLRLQLKAGREVGKALPGRGGRI